MTRKAEGGERALTKKDYISKIRGGRRIEFFYLYPRASGNDTPQRSSVKLE